MENDILDSLNDIGYQGPLTNEVAFAKALEGGPKSLEFTKLIHILADELRTLCGLEEAVNLISSVDESSSFLLELSSFLKELKCPYKCLITGHMSSRLQSKEDCLLLLDYMISELMAARMVQVDNPKEKQGCGMEIVMQESPTAKNLKEILIALKFNKPPPNITPELLFSKLETKLKDTIAKEGVNLVGKPLYNKALTDKDWKQLEENYAEMYEEYRLRRETLVTRLECTIQSFEWSDRLKSKKDAIQSVYRPKREALKMKPSVRLSDFLAARTSLLLVEKTSSATVRKNTQSDVNKVIIGQVPDRGGRPNEAQPPPPEMPSWQQRSATQGGRGGGFGGGDRGRGGRGGGEGGRGGGDRGRGGRGGRVQGGYSQATGQENARPQTSPGPYQNRQNYQTYEVPPGGYQHNGHDRRGSAGSFDSNRSGFNNRGSYDSNRGGYNSARGGYQTYDNSGGYNQATSMCVNTNLSTNETETGHPVPVGVVASEGGLASGPGLVQKSRPCSEAKKAAQNNGTALSAAVLDREKQAIGPVPFSTSLPAASKASLKKQRCRLRTANLVPLYQKQPETILPPFHASFSSDLSIDLTSEQEVSLEPVPTSFRPVGGDRSIGVKASVSDNLETGIPDDDEKAVALVAAASSNPGISVGTGEGTAVLDEGHLTASESTGVNPDCMAGGDGVRGAKRQRDRELASPSANKKPHLDPGTVEGSSASNNGDCALGREQGAVRNHIAVIVLDRSGLNMNEVQGTTLRKALEDCHLQYFMKKLGSFGPAFKSMPRLDTGGLRIDPCNESSLLWLMASVENLPGLWPGSGGYKVIPADPMQPYVKGTVIVPDWDGDMTTLKAYLDHTNSHAGLNVADWPIFSHGIMKKTEPDQTDHTVVFGVPVGEIDRLKKLDGRLSYKMASIFVTDEVGWFTRVK